MFRFPVNSVAGEKLLLMAICMLLSSHRQCTARQILVMRSSVEYKRQECGNRVSVTSLPAKQCGSTQTPEVSKTGKNVASKIINKG